MDWWQTFFDDQYLKLYGSMLPAERSERIDTSDYHYRDSRRLMVLAKKEG